VIIGVSAVIGYLVDEVGFDSWVDAQRMAVVVPDDDLGDEIAVLVARSDSWASMIACVTAHGRHLQPDIVGTQERVKVEIDDSGFPPDRCCLVRRENEFVTFQLFEDWLENVLIPDVTTQRQRLGWEGSVFLILDGFSEYLTTVTRSSPWTSGFLRFRKWNHAMFTLTLT
jgi:hypothetical protein